MTIIFIQPKRNRPTSTKARESVRIVFSKNKRTDESFVLTIYLGKKIAEKIGISKGIKVAVGYDDNNVKRLFLKKDDIGYTATEISSKDSPSLRIMLQWQQFKPTDQDFLIKEVKYEFVDDGISFII